MPIRPRFPPLTPAPPVTPAPPSPWIWSRIFTTSIGLVNKAATCQCVQSRATASKREQSQHNQAHSSTHPPTHPPSHVQTAMCAHVPPASTCLPPTQLHGPTPLQKNRRLLKGLSLSRVRRSFNSSQTVHTTVGHTWIPAHIAAWASIALSIEPSKKMRRRKKKQSTARDGGKSNIITARVHGLPKRGVCGTVACGGGGGFLADRAPLKHLHTTTPIFKSVLHASCALSGHANVLVKQICVSSWQTPLPHISWSAANHTPAKRTVRMRGLSA
jgi:hypothetical protein